MQKQLLFGIIVLLLICPLTLIGKTIIASNSINLEPSLITSLSNSLPSSAICYWNCLVRINIELKTCFTIVASNLNVVAAINTGDIVPLESNQTLNKEQTKIQSPSPSKIKIISKKRIDDLVNDETFKDVKTHNTDFRSRPRPRKRKR